MNLGGVILTLLIGRMVPVPAPPSLITALESIEITQSDAGRSAFQLSFAAGRRNGLTPDYDVLSNPLLQPFNRVVVVVTFGGVPHVLFDGVITQQQLAPGDGPAGGVFAVTGEDISILMDLEEKSIEHPAQSAEASVELILLDYIAYGVAPMVVPTAFVDIPIPLERVPIQTATDLGYIHNLASIYGYIFYVRAGPLPGMNLAYWGPPIRQGLPQKALNVNMGAATNVEGVKFTYNALAPTLVRGEVQGIEEGERLMIETVSSLRAPPLAALPAIVSNFPHVKVQRLRNDGLQEVQSYAQAQATTDRSVDGVVQAEGQIRPVRYGDILSARDLVGVRGAGWQYDGLYYVQSVTHTISRHAYTETFQLSREGVGSTVSVVRP